MTNLPYRTETGEAGWCFLYCTENPAKCQAWKSVQYRTPNRPHPSVRYGKLVISFQFAKHLTTEIRALYYWFINEL